MDTKLPLQSPVSPVTSSMTPELEHITQEMYKKNVELAQTNKILSLLRKIDDIILSSVTDPKEIATQVAQTLVGDADFQIAAIYGNDETALELSLFGLAQNQTVVASTQALHTGEILPQIIPLSLHQNILVQSVTDGKKYVTTKYLDITVSSLSLQDAALLQQAARIQTFLIFPLIVRKGVLGVLVVGHAASSQELGDYEVDLLSRLVDLVGIAMDNAILYAKVQESNVKLKEIDKLKDEFVSLASHELRTPMTAIKSYLWMALAGKGGALSDKQKYYLDRAYRSTDRLIKLVNDMLNISRIESGRISVELQDVDVPQLVTEVIEEVMPRAEELGITIQIMPSPPLPHALGDANKLKEVVINLIGNSLKFTPKDGKITASFSVDTEGLIEVAIADTGAGIPPDDISKLFQKFSLLPGSYIVNKTATQGTGLGLYICKSIIDLHNGKIWVNSQGVGKGTVFTFSLPQFDSSKVTMSSLKGATELVHTQL